jgi:hypothetical protein
MFGRLLHGPWPARLAAALPLLRAADDGPALPPDLPYGLEETRHLLDLERVETVLWSLLGLLVALALRRLARAMGRRTPATPTAQPSSSVAATARVAGPVAAIQALRDEHATQGTFREGCHDLAAFLRDHFQAARHHPFAARTVAEIRRRLTGRGARKDDDALVIQVFEQLETFQFRQEEPVAGDLDGVCQLAIAAVVGRAAAEASTADTDDTDDTDGTDGTDGTP